MNARGAFLNRSLLLSLGGRRTSPSGFSGDFVWEASAAYIIKSLGTKIRAFAGTGYRAPSLWELYGVSGDQGTLRRLGNPDLKPETSKSWEAGVDQSLFGGKLTAGATYFETRLDNVVFTRGSKYQNGGKGLAKGIEAYVSARPFEALTIDLAYSYADSRYKTSPQSQNWTRRESLPQSSVHLSLAAAPVDWLTLSVNASWRDRAVIVIPDSMTWADVRWVEKESMVWDAAATVRISERASFFVRGENIFGENYTYDGYQMPRASFHGGIDLIF